MANPPDSSDIDGGLTKITNELDSLNSMMTVIVIVFIIYVLLQLVQTILQMVKPKKACRGDPSEVIVEKSSTKKKTESIKCSSSSKRGSLPSKRMSTTLSLDNSIDSNKGTPLKTEGDIDSSSTVLNISKDISDSLKMINCSSINTPLPNQAPLSVPTPEVKSIEKKEKEAPSSDRPSCEYLTKIDTPSKDIKTSIKIEDIKTIQPPSSIPQTIPITPIQAPLVPSATQPIPTETIQIPAQAPIEAPIQAPSAPQVMTTTPVQTPSSPFPQNVSTEAPMMNNVPSTPNTEQMKTGQEGSMNSPLPPPNMNTQ